MIQIGGVWPWTESNHRRQPGQSGWALQELPPSERGQILSGQFEPLAVLAAITKTSVLVFLDSNWVISPDRVDQPRCLGQLDGKLAFAAAESIRAADLIEAAGLDQVDVAQFATGSILRNRLCIFGMVGLGRCGTDFGSICGVPLRPGDRLTVVPFMQVILHPPDHARKRSQSTCLSGWGEVSLVCLTTD